MALLGGVSLLVLPALALCIAATSQSGTPAALAQETLETHWEAAWASKGVGTQQGRRLLAPDAWHPVPPATATQIASRVLLQAAGPSVQPVNTSAALVACNCTDTPPPGESSCQEQRDAGKCFNTDFVASSYCQITCGRCACPGACICTDVPPNAGFTCAQQASWLKCNEPFMRSFCDLSCRHCPCAPAAAAPAAGAGAPAAEAVPARAPTGAAALAPAAEASASAPGPELLAQLTAPLLANGVVGGAGGLGGAGSAQLEAAAPTVEGCRDDFRDYLRGMPDLTLLNALLSLANFTLVGANTTAGGSRTTDFSGTVFLATNAAVQAFLRQQNVTQRELLEGSDKLRSVMAYHVLPRRLAYADLVRRGRNNIPLETGLPGALLTVRPVNDTSVEIVGYSSTAQLLRSDILICSTVVHVVDTVLLPASPLERVIPYSAAVEGLAGADQEELANTTAPASEALPPSSTAAGVSSLQPEAASGQAGAQAAGNGEVAFEAGVVPAAEACPRTVMEALGARPDTSLFRDFLGASSQAGLVLNPSLSLTVLAPNDLSMESHQFNVSAFQGSQSGPQPLSGSLLSALGPQAAVAAVYIVPQALSQQQLLRMNGTQLPTLNPNARLTVLVQAANSTSAQAAPTVFLVPPGSQTKAAVVQEVPTCGPGHAAVFVLNSTLHNTPDCAPSLLDAISAQPDGGLLRLFFENGGWGSLLSNPRTNATLLLSASGVSDALGGATEAIQPGGQEALPPDLPAAPEGLPAAPEEMPPLDPRIEAGYYILTEGGFNISQLANLSGSTTLRTAANRTMGVRVLRGPGGHEELQFLDENGAPATVTTQQPLARTCGGGYVYRLDRPLRPSPNPPAPAGPGAAPAASGGPGQPAAGPPAAAPAGSGGAVAASMASAPEAECKQTVGELLGSIPQASLMLALLRDLLARELGNPSFKATWLIPTDDAVRLRLALGLLGGATVAVTQGPNVLRAFGAYHIIMEGALTAEELASMEGDALPTLLPGHTITPQAGPGDARLLLRAENSTARIFTPNLATCSGSAVVHLVNDTLRASQLAPAAAAPSTEAAASPAGSAPRPVPAPPPAAASAQPGARPAHAAAAPAVGSTGSAPQPATAAASPAVHPSATPSTGSKAGPGTERAGSGTGSAGCLTTFALHEATPEFSAMTGILKSSGVWAFLNSSKTAIPPGGLTFFVPVNSAVEAMLTSLGPSARQALTGSMGAVQALVAYQTVLGKVQTSEMRDGQVLHTIARDAQGRPLSLTVRRSPTSSQVVIEGVANSATIIYPDISVCQGVVHAVDTVLLPVAPTAQGGP